MKNWILLGSFLTVALFAPTATANEMSHQNEFGRAVVDDCKEVPGDYKNAEHPYAKKPDGCSGIISSPKEVRDRWGPVNFTTACNQHDRCYYTEGSNAQKCNAEFYRELNKACVNGTSKKVKIWKKTIRIPNPPLELACKEIATAYKVGVDAGIALKVFEKAQRLQRSYNHWYQRCH